jgi:hypothetical protein
MGEATLRERVADLLSASARSDVPPFMVMDVMSAAERIEAAGGHVIHMEVGQPSAPAPKRPPIGRSNAAGSTIRPRSESRRCVSASRVTTVISTDAMSIPRGS